MSQENELARLESFISKLLEKFSKLKEENARLSSELEDKSQTIVELQERLESCDIEKIEIGDRVSRIIEKIENWEDTLDPEDEQTAVPINDPSRQGSLFQVGSDEVDEAE